MILILILILLHNKMNHLFDITYLLTTYGYLGIFIIIFLESGLFFALPGDSLLFTAGLLASVLGFNLLFLISIIFLGTFLGELWGMKLVFIWKNLRKFSFFRLILKQKYIDKAINFSINMENWRLYFLVLCRLFVLLRRSLPESLVCHINFLLNIV